MHIAAEIAEELDEIVDIVVEVEASFGARHAARVLPLGEIDIEMRQQVPHRAAEKRREMPRHRRYDQELGIAAAPGRQIPLEVNEIAERLRRTVRTRTPTSRPLMVVLSMFQAGFR